MQRDDAEFGEALDEEGEAREGDKEGGGGGGSGLPWDGDDKRDYKYEELLGELSGPAWVALPLQLRGVRAVAWVQSDCSAAVHYKGAGHGQLQG